MRRHLYVLVTVIVENTLGQLLLGHVLQAPKSGVHLSLLYMLRGDSTTARWGRYARRLDSGRLVCTRRRHLRAPPRRDALHTHLRWGLVDSGGFRARRHGGRGSGR